MTTGAPTMSPTLEDEVADSPWIVIVWDDPVNLMDYVVFVFCDVLALPSEKATELMLQVHNDGKAAVFSGAREHAELNVMRLQSHGLWASMEQ